MKLTDHFDSREWDCRDETPYPAQWIESRLRPHAKELEIIRARAGSPIIISSGYRTPEYNRKIGGARNSQHVEGRATDFTIRGWTPLALKELVLDLHRQGLIVIGGVGLYATFLHVDTRLMTKRLAYWEGSRSSN